MTRRMSCSMTQDAVRARTKTVTRRNVTSWRNLKAGDQLILVEQAMGLKKGAKQVVLTTVEVTDVRDEPLHLVDDAEVEREGFADMEPTDFVQLWLEGHHNPRFRTQAEFMAYEVRRIEWRYLDHEVAP